MEPQEVRCRDLQLLSIRGKCLQNREIKPFQEQHNESAGETTARVSFNSTRFLIFDARPTRAKFTQNCYPCELFPQIDRETHRAIRQNRDKFRYSHGQFHMTQRSETDWQISLWALCPTPALDQLDLAHVPFHDSEC
jgi:hypothetical protein